MVYYAKQFLFYLFSFFKYILLRPFSAAFIFFILFVISKSAFASSVVSQECWGTGCSKSLNEISLNIEVDFSNSNTFIGQQNFSSIQELCAVTGPDLFNNPNDPDTYFVECNDIYKFSVQNFDDGSIRQILEFYVRNRRAGTIYNTKVSAVLGEPNFPLRWANNLSPGTYIALSGNSNYSYANKCTSFKDQVIDFYLKDLNTHWISYDKTMQSEDGSTFYCRIDKLNIDETPQGVGDGTKCYAAQYYFTGDEEFGDYVMPAEHRCSVSIEDFNDDIDGDGVPNHLDDDIDGDGLLNTEDPDMDGDGIPNEEDDDMDGDGWPNICREGQFGPLIDCSLTDAGKDPDIDGDGIPNEEDPDIDGDGIPNEEDNDREGDQVTTPSEDCFNVSDVSDNLKCQFSAAAEKETINFKDSLKQTPLFLLIDNFFGIPTTSNLDDEGNLSIYSGSNFDCPSIAAQSFDIVGYDLEFPEIDFCGELWTMLYTMIYFSVVFGAILFGVFNFFR